MKLIESILVDDAEMRALRRDLHAHPELSFQENRTSELVARALTRDGVTVHRGMAKTGIVGVIKNGTSPRAVGLRADMDGLPITERNRFAHSSQHFGRMHACGHDGHVTMLLAAARQLARRRSFDGTVYLIFQPAEERDGGAQCMINDGLFEAFPMDAVFGMHNWPGLGVGRVAVRSGPVFASANEFKIHIYGRSAHAAMPHHGIDPVIIASQIVQGFQTVVSRSIRPMDAAVVSVTRICSGEATNAISDRCEMAGTVRAFSLAALDLIERRMRTIAEATCAAHDATCHFEFERNCPPLVNHNRETTFVRAVLNDVVGEEQVLDFEPTMSAEDFSFFLQSKPGCYFLIGNGDGQGEEPSAGTAALHSSSYDFNDDVISIGATIWVRLVEQWLRCDL